MKKGMTSAHLSEYTRNSTKNDLACLEGQLKGKMQRLKPTIILLARIVKDRPNYHDKYEMKFTE